MRRYRQIRMQWGILGVLLCCLLSAAAHGADPIVAAESVVMEGTVKDGLAHMRATFVLTASARGQVTLLSGALRLTDLSSDARFTVLQAGAETVCLASGAGRGQVTVAFAIPLVQTGAEQTLVLPTPHAAERRIGLTVPANRVQAACDGGALQVRHTEAGSHITVYPENSKPITLWLSPDNRRLDRPTRLSVMLDGRVDAHTDRLVALYRLSGSVLDGMGEDIHLDLPVGWLPLRVSGSGMKRWEPLPDGNGVHILRDGTQAAFNLTIACERVFSGTETQVELQFPRIHEAAQIRGNVRLAAHEGLSVRVESVENGQIIADQGLTAIHLQSSDTKAMLSLTQQPFRFDSRVEERIDVWEHGLTLHGRLTIRPRSGQTFQIRCQTTPDLRILRLSGKGLRRWTQQEQTVLLETTAPLTTALTVEFEGDVTTATTEGWRLPVLNAPDAGDQELTFSLSPQKGFDVRQQKPATLLRQVDLSQLPDWMKPATHALQGAQIDSAFQFGLARIPASIRVRGVSEFLLHEETATLRAVFAMHIRHASIFQHRIHLGKGWAVQAVTATGLREWSYNEDSGILLAKCQSALSGNASLELSATSIPGLDARTIPFSPPVYLNATRFRGAVAVATSAGWQMEIDRPEGISEIGMDRMGLEETASPSSRLSLPQQKMQANKPVIRNILPPPLARVPHQGERYFSYGDAPRSLAIHRTMRETQFYVDENIELVCERGRMRIEALLNIDIRRGGISELKFDVPDGFHMTDISPVSTHGAPTAFRPEDVVHDKDGTLLIRFPTRRYAINPIRMSCERPLQTEDKNTLSVAPIMVRDAHNIAGKIAVRSGSDGSAASDILIQETKRQFLTTERPGEARDDGLTLLQYRFSSPDALLTLGIENISSRMHRGAKVGQCRLVTRITEQGRALTRLLCRVENSGAQQFLDIGLPAHAEVWSTHIQTAAGSNRQAIKPVHDEATGRLLVPLSGHAVEATSFDLDITYAQLLDSESFGYASLDLLTPRFRDATDVADADERNMHVEQIGWEVYLPKSYDMVSHSGTLRLTVGQQSLSSRLIDAILAILAALWALFCLLADYVLSALIWLLRWGLMLGAIALVLYVISRIAVRLFTRKGETEKRIGFGLAHVLAAVAILAILAGLLLPSLSRARESARKTQSLSNLKQIGLAISMFSSEQYYGRMPENLDELYQDGEGIIGDRKAFESPLGGTYRYVGPSRRHPRPDTIIVFEVLDDDKALALFRDGHVKQVDRETLLENLQENGYLAAVNEYNDDYQSNRYQKEKEGKFWDFSLRSKRLASLEKEGREQQSYYQKKMQAGKGGKGKSSFGKKSPRAKNAPLSSKELLDSEWAYNQEESEKRLEKLNFDIAQNKMQRSAERSSVKRNPRSGALTDWLAQNVKKKVTERETSVQILSQSDLREESQILAIQAAPSVADGEGGDELARAEAAEPMLSPPPLPPPGRDTGGRGLGSSIVDIVVRNRDDRGDDDSGIEIADNWYDDGKPADAPGEVAELPEQDKQDGSLAGLKSTGTVQIGGDLSILEGAGTYAYRTSEQGPAIPFLNLGKGMTAGAMPVEVPIDTLRTGQRFVFLRDTASSAQGQLRIICLSQGFSLTLEVLMVVVLSAGLVILYRRRPLLALYMTGGGILLVSLLRLWTGAAFRPHMIAATAVLGILLCAGVVRTLWGRRARWNRI